MRARTSSSVASTSSQATRSRGVMAVETVRVSRSNTFSITCCSGRSITPACVPASASARMSSGVMRSSRCVGSPSTRIVRSVARV